MRFDFSNLYSNEQAITASAASTNSLDHGQARNLGVGPLALHLVLVVTVAFTDAGSDSTVTAALETDDNSGFTSATSRHSFTAFAALSTAGTQRKLKLGPDHINERYSRIYYTVANGNLSTGKITAGIVAEIDAWTAYPSGYEIS